MSKLYKCTTCGLKKTRDEFYKNGAHSNGLDNICKLCRRDSNKYQSDYMKERQQARTTQLRNEADLRGCQVCGNPLVGKKVNWHHKWPWLKNNDISKMGNASDETFEAEKAMCDPTCPSCHSKVHFVLRGYKNIKDDYVHEYIDKWMRNTNEAYS